MRIRENYEQEAWARDQWCAMAEGGARDRSDASVSCEDTDEEDTAVSGNPLTQLENSLQKTGVLGATLESGGTQEDVDYLDASQYGPQLPLQPQLPPSIANIDGSRKTVEDHLASFRCHLCPFQGSSKSEYSGHMASHMDHKCPLCDYRSRTEGRLKRHVKDFHSNEPLPTPCLQGTDDGSKDRTFRCRQCGHVAQSKTDFWKHSKVHIKTEKLLSCPKCPFVTEYKHHLEYHLRNHFGSKPFKCPKCNYSCVNKSMLNSHLKSHSNVYQYRCSDCSYATKYCHSLKLHLRKYMHRPAGVLNSDGSPNPFPVLDVYGTRRGPRKGPRFLQQGPQLLGHLQELLGPRSQEVVPWKCSVCDFTTADEQQLSRHVLGHAEGRDFCRLYGIRSIPTSTQETTVLERPLAVDVPYVSSTSSQDAPPACEEDHQHPSLNCRSDQKDERKGFPLDLSCAPVEPPRHRRKGRAVRLDRIYHRLQPPSENGDTEAQPEEEKPQVVPPPVVAPRKSSPSLLPLRLHDSEPPSEPAVSGGNPSKDTFRCAYCDIAFEHYVMYSVHMGYHGYYDPFTCNMCGQHSEDKLAFFLHIARAAHR